MRGRQRERKASVHRTSQRASLLRLVDANMNRAFEGIRVCEEIVRFHLESPRPFRRLRALRHAVAVELRRLPFGIADLVAARESGRDIGATARAGRTPSLERVLVINLQRVKESLRVLEECSRVVAPRRTAAFQRLRFRTYEVERDLLLELASLRHP